jgi:hypothetical protein
VIRTRITRAVAAVGSLALRIAAPFMPEPGTTEGAVMLGLLLLAGGFVLAGLAPFALIVPGAVLVGIGALPVLRRPR